jgi:hypothetical protein
MISDVITEKKYVLHDDFEGPDKLNDAVSVILEQSRWPDRRVEK